MKKNTEKKAVEKYLGINQAPKQQVAVKPTEAIVNSSPQTTTNTSLVNTSSAPTKQDQTQTQSQTSSPAPDIVASPAVSSPF